MSIDVDLLHAGDLFALLDNFNRSVTGLYGLSECNILRQGEDINTQADAVNLSARCYLDFLTIRKAAAGERN